MWDLLSLDSVCIWIEENLEYAREMNYLFKRYNVTLIYFVTLITSRTKYPSHCFNTDGRFVFKGPELNYYLVRFVKCIFTPILYY